MASFRKDIDVCSEFEVLGWLASGRQAGDEAGLGTGGVELQRSSDVIQGSADEHRGWKKNIFGGFGETLQTSVLRFDSSLQLDAAFMRNLERPSWSYCHGHL